MSLSTNQYGYIIDPMVPFTGPDGQTVKNGYVRVFLAGTTTPVITYANFDGTANQETIQLDNSGRTATKVIGSKGQTFKVCVYDAEHSQETPILTVDKVSPIGASVNATSVVTGLDSVSGDGWVKATVTDTEAAVELDPSAATELSQLNDLNTYGQTVYAMLIDGTGSPFKAKLDIISSCACAPIANLSIGQIYALVAGGRMVTLAVANPDDNKEIFYASLVRKVSDGLSRIMEFSSGVKSNKQYLNVILSSADGGNTWEKFTSIRDA